MKLNFIYILIFAVTSSKCNRELDTKYQEQILGEWHIGRSDSLMTKSFSMFLKQGIVVFPSKKMENVHFYQDLFNY